MMYDGTQTWLIVDGHNLAKRAHYTVGRLNYNGRPTGVVFGFLRQFISLYTQHACDGAVVCWDMRPYRRNEIYPDYKKKKEELTETAKLELDDYHKQVNALHNTILPAMGFPNTFRAKGYEADDLIARLVREFPVADATRVIVSTDEDLFQLLADGVVIWNPTKGMVLDQFWFELGYGIPPEKWPLVKAIAGCSSDNVPGVKGVGEKKAIQYLLGTLKPDSKAYRDIKPGDWMSNMRLVELPFAGTPLVKVDTTARPKKSEWLNALKPWGIRTLRTLIPG